MAQRIVLSLAVLAFGLTTPTWAQGKYAPKIDALSKPQLKEMNCVHDAIPENDLYVVVDVSLGLTDEDADVEKAQGVVQKAIKICADKHSWAPGVINTAVTIAVNTATVDVLTQGLSIKLPPDMINAMFAKMKQMSEADLDGLAGGQASGDPEFRQRMNAMLLGLGLPNDRLVLRDSVTAMEAAATRAAAISRWIDIRTT
jgi:hypothetical protein